MAVELAPHHKPPRPVSEPQPALHSSGTLSREVGQRQAALADQSLATRDTVALPNRSQGQLQLRSANVGPLRQLKVIPLVLPRHGTIVDCRALDLIMAVRTVHT